MRNNPKKLIIIGHAGCIEVSMKEAIVKQYCALEPGIHTVVIDSMTAFNEIYEKESLKLERNRSIKFKANPLFEIETYIPDLPTDGLDERQRRFRERNNRKPKH